MVQECYKYVDAVNDLTVKLRLIDTLRTVTAGKVVFFCFFFFKSVLARVRQIVYIHLKTCEILQSNLCRIRKAYK